MIAFLLTHPKIAVSPSESVAELSEQMLIQRLQNEELKAFNQLYKMYAANLLGVLVKIVKQRETAEDLLQDVFVKIKNNIKRYNSEKSRLFTWMLNITRNTAIDHLRLKSSKQDRSNIIFEDAGSALDLFAHSMNIDAIGMKSLVDGLSPKHKLMIHLFYYKGYTHTEMAELLDMPMGSIKTSIRQAILSLRVIFDIS